ncbi:MAG: D-amino acid dehydrogenase [Allorhizobium sp.]
MKICVIGAGVVGLTTAYFLARDGHEVIVVDRNGSPAQETSYANGGQLSYSYVAPLAAPSIFPSLPKYLLDRQSPLGFRLRADPAQWRWLLNFLIACTPGMFQRHTAELAMLADFSREAMHDLMQAEMPDFDFNRFGKLVIHRDRKSFDNAVALATYQKELGAEQEVLDAERCIALEPALAGLRGRFQGGVFTPSEEAGDCRKFCEALDGVLQEKYGVTRLYHHRIGSLRAEKGKIRAVSTDRGDIEAEHFVMAAGLTSRELMRPLGLSLPLYALKGYSLTVAVPEGSERLAPKISVTDSQNKIVYARLGDSLRIAAMVDIGATDAAVDPRRLETLKKQVHSTFPGLSGLERARSWAGLRPATAEGKPIIGRTAYPNLLLNVGHGALGFTLASGSARLIRDLIEDRAPPLDLAPFALGHVH